MSSLTTGFATSMRINGLSFTLQISFVSCITRYTVIDVCLCGAGQVQRAELHHGEASWLPLPLPLLALQLHHHQPSQDVCALY